LDKDISQMIEKYPKTNRGIANIIHKKYGTEFICVNPASSVDKRVWYQFDGLIWRPKAYNILRDFISNDTMKAFFNAENIRYHDLFNDMELQIEQAAAGNERKQ
jgi:hypothetical protein